MSRSRSRARQRRQRLVSGLREAVIQARNADAEAAQSPAVKPGNGELYRVLCDIERAGLFVWGVADAIHCTEDERAMIAQVVAPALAGMTPGNVLHRHKLAE